MALSKEDLSDIKSLMDRKVETALALQKAKDDDKQAQHNLEMLLIRLSRAPQPVKEEC